MSDISWNVTDNSKQVLEALEKQKAKALEECGLIAEGYAKLECPVDTGNLRNSITHRQVKDDEYIGTNIEYGKYVELGTGVYATNGDGRKTPWSYMREDGVFIRNTVGSKPHPFIKPAVANHADEYRQIIKDELKG